MPVQGDESMEPDTLLIYARRRKDLQALFKDERIKVWCGSLWESSPNFRWFLRRFIRILTHEICHMVIAKENLDQPARKCKGEEWICELMER